MNFWFFAGSQNLYGEDTLRQVAENTKVMVAELNKSPLLPFELVYKDTVKSSSEITKLMEEANHDPECAGIITYMHTFSPSKMWITGLSRLNKPYCHLHTQFNRDLPFDTIDMDFMNLTQSAHGDREHGFIAARLRKPRKIVVGHWQNEETIKGLADFMRAAVGVKVSRNLKLARFGDNMREVAVTEGDKIEAQLRLGWEVNTHPLGDLVKYVNAVTDVEIEKAFSDLCNTYTLMTDNVDSVKYQLIMEIAIKKFLDDGGFSAFTTTFEDLHGLDQLPGLACQILMSDGYGFAGEGDWKTSALLRIMKEMSKGLNGGTSFMEDYTYHLEKGNELSLGAHMLEVCPSIAAGKPTVEVHPLGIGNKMPPARLKFTGAKGDATMTTIVDMGGRFRMICCDIKAIAPLKDMPNLPVASVMWKPIPDLQTVANAWILSGGAHHSVLSYALTADNMRDFAEFMDIEFIHIGAHTNVNELKKELLWNDLAYKLK